MRPNLFLQNVPESTIPSIDGAGSFYADAGEARISMVDTRDVAAVAAVALTEPGHSGAHYDVTGPEAAPPDVAAKLSRVPSLWMYPTTRCGTRCWASASTDRWFANALVGLYQDYRRSGIDGYAAQVTGTVARLTGRPARSLDDLLGELGPG